MGLTFEPRVVTTEYPGEELWVQTLQNGYFETGIRLDKKQFTYLELTRDELEQFRIAIDAALLEALP